ncbi:MAG: aquaporin [Thermoleophilaceae bacterium]|nr:aquaporin [Thermoleophilaceae bacterium]
MPQDRGPAAYIGEFVGTFALVFFITAVVSLYIVPGPAGAPPPFIDFSVIGFVHVFVLFMLIQTLAVVSGAHFNPAVTAAMTALRQIKPIDAAIYVVVQLAGGVAGALLTKALLNDEGKSENYGAVGVTDLVTGAGGFVAEFIGAFFLMWAIVGVAVHPEAVKDWAGFVIGGTLGFAVMVFAPLTGAGFNPARAFGPALVSGEFGGAGEFLLVFILAPVLGATVAGVGYFYLFIQPGKKGPEGMDPVG